MTDLLFFLFVSLDVILPMFKIIVILYIIYVLMKSMSQIKYIGEYVI